MIIMTPITRVQYDPHDHNHQGTILSSWSCSPGYNPVQWQHGGLASWGDGCHWGGQCSSLLVWSLKIVVMIKMLGMNGLMDGICHMMTMVTLWMSLTSRLGEKTFWFRPNKSHPLWLSLSGWSLKLGPVRKLTNAVFEISRRLWQGSKFPIL